MSGRELEEADIVNLFAARGDAAHSVVRCADELRRATVGDTVTYVVNRNINYTNVCKYRCKFCAFSKGSPQKMRGRPYELDLGEIARRTAEAWERGATEVCLQGGIHPDYTGETYLAICHAVKKAAPEIHIHAFSPLEIWQGAGASDCSVRELLQDLRSAGLASVPGTAAEIFDGEIRALIAPGKVTTDQWLDVIRTAHAVGLKSTSTIMFGHVERPRHWADHLLTLRRLQAETGSLTEFVPLPFVHMEAPMYLKGQARSGPSSREALLMHAVARLVLHPLISNIQTSWVKMGPDGAAAALDGGANDLGGTLMNESISRAAGSAHGQEFSPSAMDELIRSRGRTPRQRTTLYAMASPERRRAARCAGDIAPVILPDAGRHTRIRTPNV